MRIGAGMVDFNKRTAVRGTSPVRGKRFSEIGPETTRVTDESRMAAMGEMIRRRQEEENDRKSAQAGQMTLLGCEAADGESGAERSEAVKIYEAAFQGGENPIENRFSAPKVPYGYLAKDGVITYNGVLFVCDERTNSICLGDVSDPKQVINVTLSEGGHLKVNRANLNQLGKAIGMFSPEDVNLIMRAIHQDTKVQSMQKEIEDLEAGVGEQIASGGDAAGDGDPDNSQDG